MFFFNSPPTMAQNASGSLEGVEQRDKRKEEQGRLTEPEKLCKVGISK